MKTKEAFTVNHIFFATVPPFNKEKRYKNKFLKYRVITTKSGTSDYLFDIFDKASDDCRVEIIFKSDDSQFNQMREALVELTLTNDVAEKEVFFQEVTRKMYDITDERNGTGLFVLIEGKKGAETRLMLCRFKGAQGLHNEGDDLKYLSQVFTRQNNHYKLAVFQDIVSSRSFWKGYAIDRQTASNNYKPFSNFWIEQFLQAETAITNAQGTAQFSKIVKNVLNTITKLKEKEQLISAIINLKTKPTAKMSIKSFSDKYLSDELPNKIKEQTNNEEFYNTDFGVAIYVLEKELGSTVLELEGGITAFIPTFSYQDHVTEQEVQKGLMKITIEGLLKDKKINKDRQKKKSDDTSKNEK